MTDPSEALPVIAVFLTEEEMEYIAFVLETWEKVGRRAGRQPLREHVSLVGKVAQARAGDMSLQIVADGDGRRGNRATTGYGELMTQGQAADALGFRSRQAVGRMLDRGEIEYRTVNGRRRVLRASVDRFLAGTTVSARPPVRAPAGLVAPTTKENA